LEELGYNVIPFVTIFEKVAPQDDEITKQSKELTELRHELARAQVFQLHVQSLSDLHDRLDFLLQRVNKRDEYNDQEVIEELRVVRQEIIDTNKRLDYLAEFVNKQKHDK